MMDTFYDYFIWYDGIIAGILNISCFLIMTIVKSRKDDSFNKLMRAGKFIESFLPLMIGILCQARSIEGFSITSCKGLCHAFESPIACKLGLVLSLASINFTVGIVSIACLWRKVKYSKLNVIDIIFLIFCLIVGPLPQLITLSGMTTLDENFVPMNTKEAFIKENYMSDEFTIIIVRNDPMNAFSWAASANLIILIICLFVGIIYYYIPIEYALNKARKEAQTNTAEKIKFNIYYMRFSMGLLFFCVLLPSFTLMILSLFDTSPVFLNSIRLIIFPGLLTYCWISPFVCLYNYYKVDIALYRKKKVVVVSSNGLS
uniref:G_PROTEIN_RECEP_F1_2 domain-containing protein n=1 Tax=Rhabditophanes sp. KR3021 TaxID=114890 RepID=A0AC35U254_9BILA